MKRALFMIVFLTSISGSAYCAVLDEVQGQYMTSMSNITVSIAQQRTQLILNYDQKNLQRKREFEELRYRGYIPLSVKLEGRNLEAEGASIEEKISNLEKEREALRLDMLKYYKGSLPDALKEALSDIGKREHESISTFTGELARVAREGRQ
jgi:hypothetical protein